MNNKLKTPIEINTRHIAHIKAKFEQSFEKVKNIGYVNIPGIVARITAFLIAVEGLPNMDKTALAVCQIKLESLTCVFGSANSKLLAIASSEILNRMSQAEEVDSEFDSEDMIRISDLYFEQCYVTLKFYDDALALLPSFIEKARIERAKIKVLLHLLNPKPKVV